uniref:Ribonuclease P/MRP protein subunit POP5 n=1 Tax=Meloidogyne hapla TaxID=6305 RepID=A0A1I8BMS0_MELHA
MVKLKRRYMLVELQFMDDRRDVFITGSDIYHSILDQVGRLHGIFSKRKAFFYILLLGDYGVGAICGSFQVKVRDPSTNTAVIRINSNECSFVSTAIPFILKIGKCRCTLQLLFEGSSIRTVERFLLRSNLNMLYTKLRAAESEEEKSSLRVAIRSITGPRVAHIRM